MSQEEKLQQERHDRLLQDIAELKSRLDKEINGIKTSFEKDIDAVIVQFKENLAQLEKLIAVENDAKMYTIREAVKNINYSLDAGISRFTKLDNSNTDLSKSLVSIRKDMMECKKDLGQFEKFKLEFTEFKALLKNIKTAISRIEKLERWRKYITGGIAALILIAGIVKIIEYLS